MATVQEQIEERRRQTILAQQQLAQARLQSVSRSERELRAGGLTDRAVRQSQLGGVVKAEQEVQEQDIAFETEVASKTPGYGKTPYVEAEYQKAKSILDEKINTEQEKITKLENRIAEKKRLLDAKAGSKNYNKEYDNFVEDKDVIEDEISVIRRRIKGYSQAYGDKISTIEKVNSGYYEQLANYEESTRRDDIQNRLAERRFKEQLESGKLNESVKTLKEGGFLKGKVTSGSFNEAIKKYNVEFSKPVMYASPEVAKRIKAEGLNTGKVRISELEYETVEVAPTEEVKSVTIPISSNQTYTLPSNIRLSPVKEKGREVYSSQLGGFVSADQVYRGRTETAIVRMPTEEEQAKIESAKERGKFLAIASLPAKKFEQGVDYLSQKILMAYPEKSTMNITQPILTSQTVQYTYDSLTNKLKPVTSVTKEVTLTREQLAGPDIIALRTAATGVYSVPYLGTALALSYGAKGTETLTKPQEKQLTYEEGEKQGYTKEQIDTINQNIIERNKAIRTQAYFEIGAATIPLVIKAVQITKGAVELKALPVNRVKVESIRSYTGVGTKGRDIYFTSGGKTISNEVLYPSEELARSGREGSYAIVKAQSKLGKFFGKEPKLIYAGIPVSKFNSAKLIAAGLPADKVARAQAIKLLQRAGYTEARAKQLIRFNAPIAQIQKREYARLFVNPSGKSVTGVSVTSTRQPIMVVDSKLGIKTRAAREIKDVSYIYRRSFNVGDKQKVAELTLTKTYIPSKSTTIPKKEVIRFGLSGGKSTEDQVYSIITKGGSKGQVYKIEPATYIDSQIIDKQIFPRAKGLRAEEGLTILTREEVPVLTVEQTGASTRKISRVYRKLPEPTPPIKPTQSTAQTTTTPKDIFTPTKEVRKTTEEGIGGLAKAEYLESVGIDTEMSSLTASPLLKTPPALASPVIPKTYLPTSTATQVQEGNLLLRGALLTTGITKLNVGIKERLVLTPTEKVANEYLTKAEPQFKMDIQQQTLMKEIQTSTSKISPTLKKEIKLEVKPIQEIKLDQTTKLKTRPTLKRPRDLKEKLKEKLKQPPITIETKGKLQEIASKIGTEEFEVFTKAFGKDVSIGKFTTKERAKEKLIGELRGTLRASGFIQKGEKKLKVSELGILSTEFGRSKREEYRLVQRKESRFGGFGERKEVQYFRKKSKGGFGL
jgi:hypothetical protein